MSKSLIKWGMIGCGSVTEKKSGPAFNQVANSRLEAVMRRDQEKLQDYATRHQITKFTTNADEVINDPEVDAIYIATPPDTHKEYALKVAAANKICCVEKPMALNYQECQQMVEAFNEINKPLFVSYYRRSLPRFNHVKSLIESGQIGEVRHVRWDFSRQPNKLDLNREYNWRTVPSISGGGYFVDLASHGLDLFIYLLGDVEQVHGIKQNQQGLYEAEDAVTACWKHKSGATGSGFWNFAASEKNDTVTIYGSDGIINFSIFNEAEVQLQSKNGQQSFIIEHPDNIQYYHIDNMIQHIGGQATHPSTGEQAMKVSWMMDQILSTD
ncbi:Gfo/Idh/MocA family protein [Aliikangiella coralliicola]|uniref:Gfo/Idh/MocA family oxidoreductase n=1 Tax=Aliikangiella coralliicola TaxID=2592383 RepID=A0A545U8Q1_9GAMM|nr:Gfo/Idh/MocA family oxidoreductase [Aliikangiella coralliicola]TQV85850.1 Gfo/Idh/MocA family oxidoreductase [Aliikangiella coralliicola]